MASYRVLKHTKAGKPRIEITIELGYGDDGERIRKYKTITLNSLSDRAIKKANTDLEIATASEPTKKLEKLLLHNLRNVGLTCM